MTIDVAVNKNIASSLAATLINMLSPIIVIPLLITKLGMDFYGVYVTALAFIALCLVLGEFGFTMVIPKVFANVTKVLDSGSDILSIFFITKFIYFFLVSFVLVKFNINTGVEHKFILILFGMQLVSLEPLLNGMQKFQVTMKANLINKLLFLFFVLLMNFDGSQLTQLILLQSFCYFISQVYVIYYLFFKLKFRFKLKFLSIFYRKDIVLDCAEFYLSKVFVNLYQQASAYFVSIFCISSYVAIYSVALQLYKLGQSLIGAVAQVLYTNTLRTKSLSSIINLTKITLGCYFLGGIIIAFCGEKILNAFFDGDSLLLFDISVVLYISLFFVIFSSYFGYPSLSPLGMDRLSHAGVLLSALVYFSCFMFSFLFLKLNLHLFVVLILLADFSGATLRVFFSYKHWRKK